MSAEQEDRGRGRIGPRPRAVLQVAVGAAAAVGLVAVAVYGAVADPPGEDGTRRDLAAGWAGESGGPQVLGGERVAGRPTVQRMVHDGVQFTVSVAPARPGPNLVRVDTVVPDDGGDAAHGGHAGHGGAAEPVVRVSTADGAPTVRARPRPGVDGLWAVVDLPEESGTVLVSHGPDHRIPFVVSTGKSSQQPPPGASGASGASVAAGGSVWTGPDGPECLARSTGALVSGNPPSAGRCPSEGLTGPDRDALTTVVRTLAERGVDELAVSSDASPRSTGALAAVRREAAAHDLVVVTPETKPGKRSALLVLSGWSSAARELARVSATPLREQPMRSDGTWLAPWLLSPGVIDSTAGAMIPLGFDIRDGASLGYSQTLRKYLPGQAPTASGFAGWRGRDTAVGPPRLYAASRAAYMPASGTHTGHETTISWFPGGTITPVGPFRAP